MSKPFRNRIVGQGTEAPDQLLANPFNFRRHPKEQLDALDGALTEIGWIQQVIVNRVTGHMIDGHARVEHAIRRRETEVPVLYVELTEREERIALASLDPITGLAYQDDDALTALLEGIEVESASLGHFLDKIRPGQENEKADQAGIRSSLTEQFIIPPFSVLDARQGYWADRKRLWISVGIRSELGRGQDGDKTKGGMTYSISAQPPDVLDRKRELEAQDGRTYTWSEFAEAYPDEITLAGDSIFDPVLAEIAYRWFAPPGGAILDPFAGGSVRGVVAGMLGYSYTGIDLRAEQVEANRKNWKEIEESGGTAQEKPEPIQMSAAWAVKHFNCTVAHITEPNGCAGVCCRHKTTWPAKAYPGNVCEHLGDKGCSLSPADKPASCQLYPFIFNSTGKLVMHDKAQLPTSFCNGAAGNGPMLIDAMRTGLVNLFGKEQFDQARQDVLEGRDATFFPSHEVAAAFAREREEESANKPVTPRTKAAAPGTPRPPTVGVHYAN